MSIKTPIPRCFALPFEIIQHNLIRKPPNNGCRRGGMVVRDMSRFVPQHDLPDCHLFEAGTSLLSATVILKGVLAVPLFPSFALTLTVKLPISECCGIPKKVHGSGVKRSQRGKWVSVSGGLPLSRTALRVSLSAPLTFTFLSAIQTGSCSSFLMTKRLFSSK